MIEYVVQPAKGATKIGRACHERLREAVFNDKAILQITLTPHGLTPLIVLRIRSEWGAKDELAEPQGVVRPFPLSHHLLFFLREQVWYRNPTLHKVYLRTGSGLRRLAC